MIEKIKLCRSCKLCENQRPLLDNAKSARIMVVGLSAKVIQDITEIPLDGRTRSGKLVSILEEKAQKYGYSFYRTNLVKCVPLDNNGKLRYPTKEEIDICFKNLILEMDFVDPKIVVLFGGIVEAAFVNNLQLHFSKNSMQQYKLQKKGSRYYISMYHPSYVLRSKVKKECFIRVFSELIKRLL